MFCQYAKQHFIANNVYCNVISGFFIYMVSKFKVKHFIVGVRPNSTSQTCQPRCRLGQCCMDGKCLCIDPATFQVDDCGCMLNYLYEVNYIVFMVHC